LVAPIEPIKIEQRGSSTKTNGYSRLLMQANRRQEGAY